MAKGRRVLSADGLTLVCSLSWTWCLFTLHNRPQVFSLSVCPTSLGFSRPLSVITQTTLLIAVWSRGGPFLQQKSHVCFSDTLFSHLFQGVFCGTLGRRLFLSWFGWKLVFNLFTSFRQSLFSLLI